MYILVLNCFKIIFNYKFGFEYYVVKCIRKEIVY